MHADTAKPPNEHKEITMGSFGLESDRHRDYTWYLTKPNRTDLSEKILFEVMGSMDWDSAYFDLMEETHFFALLRRYLEEHPQYEGHRIIFFNCLNWSDPQHDRHLRDHCGLHPKTMLGCATYLDEAGASEMAQALVEFCEHPTKHIYT